MKPTEGQETQRLVQQLESDLLELEKKVNELIRLLAQKQQPQGPNKASKQ